MTTATSCLLVGMTLGEWRVEWSVCVCGGRVGCLVHRCVECVWGGDVWGV